MSSTTAVLAGLRAAQHLVTRLGDAGFPPISVSVGAFGDMYVHLDKSARLAADTLALDVTESQDAEAAAGYPAYTVVHTKVSGIRVGIFGTYDPRPAVVEPEPEPTFPPGIAAGWVCPCGARGWLMPGASDEDRAAYDEDVSAHDECAAAVAL